MYSTREALKIIKKLEGEAEAVCIEGESEFGSCVGHRLHYVEGELHCEEDDWLGYSCPEDSIPKHFKWIIDIS